MRKGEGRIRKWEWGMRKYSISNFRFGIAEWIRKGQEAEGKEEITQNDPKNLNHLIEHNAMKTRPPRL